MKKILVIDDESSTGEIIQDFLSDLGYQTLIATDAKRGMELVELENPDLILLDILMPGISGLECLRRIKSMKPDAIVVVVSGLKEEETAKEAIRGGAYDYLTKPFDLSYLQSDLLARIFPNH